MGVGFLRSDNDAKPLGPNVWCETGPVGRGLTPRTSPSLMPRFYAALALKRAAF